MPSRFLWFVEYFPKSGSDQQTAEKLFDQSKFHAVTEK